MAPLVTITTSELKALLKKLSRALSKDKLDKIALRLGGLVGAAAEARAREYPKPARKKLEKIYTLDVAFGRKVKPYKSIFKSAKQAAFVILSLRDGKLVVPRKRTGTLGKSITHSVKVVGTHVGITVGTNLGYAEKVIGKPPAQSWYHQGTWTPLVDAVSSNEALDEYREILKTNLKALVAGLLKE